MNHPDHRFTASDHEAPVGGGSEKFILIEAIQFCFFFCFFLHQCQISCHDHSIKRRKTYEGTVINVGFFEHQVKMGVELSCESQDFM